MTATIDQVGARGFAASSRPDNQQIFLRAQRHSRRVRILRVAVPAGTVAVLAAITLVSWLDPMRILSRLPTAGGQLVVSGTKITMSSPKLAPASPRMRGHTSSTPARRLRTSPIPTSSS
jgi:hypothetical protein